MPNKPNNESENEEKTNAVLTLHLLTTQKKIMQLEFESYHKSIQAAQTGTEIQH